jgi:hypothetical protein
MTVNDLRTNNSNALISFAAVIVIVYGMQAAKVLLVPFLLAVFLALIAIRPMLWLQKHKVPSAIAALAIVILMMLIIGMVGGIVGSSIAEFTAALPAYQARLDVIVQGTLDFVASLVGDDKSFDDPCCQHSERIAGRADKRVPYPVHDGFHFAGSVQHGNQGAGSIRSRGRNLQASAIVSAQPGSLPWYQDNRQYGDGIDRRFADLVGRSGFSAAVGHAGIPF